MAKLCSGSRLSITFPPPSTNKVPREAWKVLAILNQLPEERGRMNTPITETIKDEVLKWPGITIEPNRFGGSNF